MMIKSVFILSLFISSAFAQTKTKTATTPTPAPQKSLLKLEDAKAYADAEIKRLEKAIAESATSRNLVPCDYYALKMQLQYNRWFVDPKHYDVLKEMSDKIDATVANVNAKLASLENETVNVLVREGQSAQTNEVPVGFKDLIDFFRLYDDRMKTCPKDQKAVMMKLMEEEPDTNPMHIVLSQVRSAGGMMSVNLNASLQEPGASYQLVMTPKECGYTLELRVELELNGVKQIQSFSLLQGDLSTHKVEFTEQAKWEMLSKGNLDKMPIDGLLRYRKFQAQFQKDCPSLATVPMARHGVPYVKYDQLTGIVDDLKKQGYQWTAEMEFVAIEPGTFQMGSPTGETRHSSDEVQHQVTLTHAFEIQTTEVTQAQWFEVMKTNPSTFKQKSHCLETWNNKMDQGGMCPNHPVDSISWDDAQIFIQKMNERNDDYVYRLPTEAEWEYAARGGSTTAYFNGDDDVELRKVAWTFNNSGSQTQEVASTGQPNAFGLYDVHGNVNEWVQDFYGSYAAGAQTNPTGPSSGTYRIARGGSYFGYSYELRSAIRIYHRSYDANHQNGLRLVRTVK